MCNFAFLFYLSLIIVVSGVKHRNLAIKSDHSYFPSLQVEIFSEQNQQGVACQLFLFEQHQRNKSFFREMKTIGGLGAFFF